MARMIPKECAPDTESRAERDLFKLFKEKLSKKWVVFHSFDYVDDSRATLREGECDFIAIHPKYGILCIEAKGGTISYEDQVWTQAGKTLDKSPVSQASKAMHYIEKQFKMAVPSWDKWNLTMGYGVAFPETLRYPASLPHSLKQDMVFIQEHCEDPEKRLIAMMQAWGRQSIDLSPEQIKQLIDTLAPFFQLVPALSAQLTGLDEELVRLTQQQAMILDNLREFPQAIIQGCAGSGKTMLAVEKARRLADSGRKVLFLCFNRPLKDYLRETCSSVDNLFIFNFHGLCLQAVGKAGIDLKMPSPDDDRTEFWSRELPNAFMDAVGQWPYRYDALVVDEAQDFESDWWVPIMELLKGDENIIYLFQDSAQNIFHREKEFPIQGPAHCLTMNCRNTKRIAEVAHGFAKIEASISPFVPEGVSPEFHSCDENGEWETVRKLVHRLVENDGIRHDQVVILGQHSFDHTPFAENPSLGNSIVVEQAATSEKTNEIRYSSIYRFKGLEADCVILLPVEVNEKIDADAVDALKYVASSRAKFLLHVIENH